MPAHTPSDAAHHSHPNYIKIWAILVVLLVISVLGPMIGIKAVTLATAFGIAIVKALMVAAWFMHLNVEKRFVWYMLLAGLLFMVLMFAGLAPDILNEQGQHWHQLQMDVAPGPETHGGH